MKKPLVEVISAEDAKIEIQEYLVDGYEIFFIPDDKLTDTQRRLKHDPKSWKRYYKLGRAIMKKESAVMD